MKPHILGALQLIKEAEGFSSKIYFCSSNKETIGYGRNLEAEPLKDYEVSLCTNPKGEIEISESLAEEWLLEKIYECEKYLSKKSYWSDLNSARKACLIDFVYNVGRSTFSKFLDLDRGLSSGDFELAAQSLELGSDKNGKSKYYNQVGIRAKRNIQILRTGLDNYDFYRDHSRI